MRKLFAGAALAAMAIVPSIARAAEGAATTAEAGKADLGPFSLSAGVDWVSSYIFRGYEITDSGVIVQPSVQVNAKVYESDSLTVTPYIGNWNSIQSDDDPGDGAWFESDIYGGVDVGMDKFTLGVIYTDYTYPDNAFGAVQEWGVKLSYDDSDFAKQIGSPVAIKPYVAWYIETSDDNEGAQQDQYAEVGVNPSLAPEGWPVALNFPVAVGLSPDGFFLDEDGHNETFGYVSVGAYATYALSSIPAKYGEWALYGGVTYYQLLADSVQDAQGEDTNYEITGKIGLTFSY